MRNGLLLCCLLLAPAAKGTNPFELVFNPSISTDTQSTHPIDLPHIKVSKIKKSFNNIPIYNAHDIHIYHKHNQELSCSSTHSKISQNSHILKKRANQAVFSITAEQSIERYNNLFHFNMRSSTCIKATQMWHYSNNDILTPVYRVVDPCVKGRPIVLLGRYISMLLRFIFNRCN